MDWGKSGNLFCVQMNWNVKFEPVSLIVWGSIVIGSFHSWKDQMCAAHQCWKVYATFRATCASIQITCFPGKAFSKRMLNLALLEKNPVETLSPTEEINETNMTKTVVESYSRQEWNISLPKDQQLVSSVHTCLQTLKKKKEDVLP